MPFTRRTAAILAFMGGLTLMPLGRAAEGPESDSAGPAVIDALVVRPMMLARTLFGIGTFLVSLPFTIPGDNVDAAAEVLVVEPARDTFLRPLGEGRSQR